LAHEAAPGFSFVTTQTSRPHPNLDAASLDLILQLVAAAYRTPSPALRDDLAAGTFTAAIEALAEAAGVPAPALAEANWATLESSHVALFVAGRGGVAAPPYVGFAADDELLGPTAEELAGLYRQHGIEIDPHWSDLPDQVAAVAEAGLLLLEADRDAAARDLLVRFLHPWFHRYADAIAAADVSGFYGPLTEFLCSVMSEVASEAAA
jgi:TorA maturation chaperone TorD